MTKTFHLSIFLIASQSSSVALESRLFFDKSIPKYLKSIIYPQKSQSLKQEMSSLVSTSKFQVFPFCWSNNHFFLTVQSVLIVIASIG